MLAAYTEERLEETGYCRQWTAGATEQFSVVQTKTAGKSNIRPIYAFRPIVLPTVSCEDQINSGGVKDPMIDSKSFVAQLPPYNLGT